MMKSDAQRDRVLHVVIGRTSLRRTLNVLKTYAQHAAKKVTITRIAPPVNKSISATGHSARECPSKTVSICNSCGDAAHQQHSYPSYAQRQLSLPTFHQRQRYPRSQSRQVVRQVLRRRNHRRPHLPHAVTVDSIGHAFGPMDVAISLPRSGSLMACVASQVTVGPMPLETSPVPNA